MKIQNQKGFSIIFIVMCVMAVSLLAVGIASFGFKLNKIAKEGDTVKRMNVIQNAFKNFYLSHQQLPALVNVNQIPVLALNLEQKYKLDAHGRFFYYDVNDETNITGITVNGNNVAAVVISGGSNQKIDSNDDSSSTYPDLDWGDDVWIEINLSAEANANVLEELRVLDHKRCLSENCGNGIAIGDELQGVIGEFALSENYRQDPWLQDYHWNGTQFYSFGQNGVDDSNTGDDISVPVMTNCCN